MTRSAAATTASMPIQKCSRKATSRKNGVQGASNIAATTGLAIVVRIEFEVAHRLRRERSESAAIIWLRILGASKASSRWLARTSSRLRTMSSADSVSSARAERQGDEQQGGLAGGRDDPVVNLQHVQASARDKGC